jgi:3D (Asp-Asp-Asp) domain-containing protein
VRGPLPHLCAALVALVALAAAAGDAAAFRRGSTLVVRSTAYSGAGTTFTGARTRHGICAVDPKVIPLGTRFLVPGYGRCLAADIGSGVVGASIDVWVAKERTALIWGVRTVRIRFL